MSITLATKGIISTYSEVTDGGDPYPVGIESIEATTEGVIGPLIDVDTGDIPSTPQVLPGIEVQPDLDKRDGMSRVLPRFNIFPEPTDL